MEGLPRPRQAATVKASRRPRSILSINILSTESTHRPQSICSTLGPADTGSQRSPRCALVHQEVTVWDQRDPEANQHSRESARGLKPQHRARGAPGGQRGPSPENWVASGRRRVPQVEQGCQWTGRVLPAKGGMAERGGEARQRSTWKQRCESAGAGTWDPRMQRRCLAPSLSDPRPTPGTWLGFTKCLQGE